MRRQRKGRKILISRRAEVRTLALIVTIIAFPLIGTLWVISATSRPDLSDLAPIQTSVETYVLLNWSTLLREHSRALNSGSSIFAGTQVRALGYMVEAARAIDNGAWVQDFVLLPEAGNLIHPAHRFGDQMIAVHLREDNRVQFSSRALVWVWGTFQALPGDPAQSKPLYLLERARVQSADMRQIAQYFK